MESLQSQWFDLRHEVLSFPAYALLTVKSLDISTLPTKLSALHTSLPCKGSTGLELNCRMLTLYSGCTWYCKVLSIYRNSAVLCGCEARSAPFGIQGNSRFSFGPETKLDKVCTTFLINITKAKRCSSPLGGYALSVGLSHQAGNENPGRIHQDSDVPASGCLKVS